MGRFKLLLGLLIVAVAATEARVIRSGIAPTQGAFALGRAWTEDPVITIPGRNFTFAPNETAFAAVSLPLRTNTTTNEQVFVPVTAPVIRFNISLTNNASYFDTFKDAIIALSTAEENRSFKRGVNPIAFVLKALRAGAVGAVINIPSLVNIPPNTQRRLTNTFLLETNAPVMWITDSGYSNLTSLMDETEANGTYLVISIIEPQNATIIFEYAKQMQRSWVVLTQAYLGIFVALLVAAVCVLFFRFWAMRNARQAGLVARDVLLYLVLSLIVIETIILITIVSDYGGINNRLPWMLSSHASVMFHAAATSSPIVTLAVWWATIALDRIKLGFFTAKNIRILGAVAMTILWSVAIIQMLVEPLVDNFSNTWAAITQMLVVITCAVFCMYVGLKFALRLSRSKKFNQKAMINKRDAAMKRIETILVRTSFVLLIVLVTLLIFIPVAIMSTVNILSPMFASFIYTTCSIVQMVSVIIAVFTFPRNYSKMNSRTSSRHLSTSSGSRSANGQGN